MLTRAVKNGWQITVPATALAQAFRDRKRQANLSTLLKRPHTVVVPLSEEDASQVGKILAATGAKDIADAHVALCALREGQAIATSDPDDLHHLAPDIELIPI